MAHLSCEKNNRLHRVESDEEHSPLWAGQSLRESDRKRVPFTQQVSIVTSCDTRRLEIVCVSTCVVSVIPLDDAGFSAKGMGSPGNTSQRGRRGCLDELAGLQILHQKWAARRVDDHCIGSQRGQPRPIHQISLEGLSTVKGHNIGLMASTMETFCMVSNPPSGSTPKTVAPSCPTGLRFVFQ